MTSAYEQAVAYRKAVDDWEANSSTYRTWVRRGKNGPEPIYPGKMPECVKKRCRELDEMPVYQRKSVCVNYIPNQVNSYDQGGVISLDMAVRHVKKSSKRDFDEYDDTIAANKKRKLEEAQAAHELALQEEIRANLANRDKFEYSHAKFESGGKGGKDRSCDPVREPKQPE